MFSFTFTTPRPMDCLSEQNSKSKAEKWGPSHPQVGDGAAPLRLIGSISTAGRPELNPELGRCKEPPG